MREFSVDGVTCRYEIGRRPDGSESAVCRDTVLFLHGWGGDLRSFARAYSVVGSWGVRCVNLEFPKTVPPEWGIYDYAAHVHSLLKSESIENPIVVGHSFGGRVALILAAQGLCKSIVLVDSAGLKPHFSLRKRIKIARYHSRVKRGKPLDGMGSLDYNNVDVGMRKVFVRIVNTHLDKLLPYIKCKTLIFWGKRDRDTPPYMARRLKRRIAGSEIVTVDGGHYSYLDSDYKFFGCLKSFILE